MKNTRILGLTLLPMILALSCKKNDPAPTASELLSRNWKQTDLILTANGASQSIFSQLSICEADNIYQFKSDGTLNITEGATKCDPADPDIAASGTWQLQENNTKLALSDDVNGTQKFTIESLSATDMVISDTATVSGLLTKGSFYFKAQ
jgi:hypothetical protein